MLVATTQKGIVETRGDDPAGFPAQRPYDRLRQGSEVIIFLGSNLTLRNLFGDTRPS